MGVLHVNRRFPYEFDLKRLQNCVFKKFRNTQEQGGDHLIMLHDEEENTNLLEQA